MEAKVDEFQPVIDLIRSGRSGAFSTVEKCGSRRPYCSFVTYATDVVGNPIFLFSDLSDHTTNLKNDRHVALLIENASRLKRPQTGARVTLLGKISRTKNPKHVYRFLSRHPNASLYANFSDFNFYRMKVTEGHFIGGFAQSRWFKGGAVIGPSVCEKLIATAERDILDHMNTDHKEAVRLFANVLCKRKGLAWKMVGVDCDGFDLMSDEKLVRLNFRSRVLNPSDIELELRSLAEKARKLIVSKSKY